jgi:hypothetical protein
MQSQTQLAFTVMAPEGGMMGSTFANQLVNVGALQHCFCSNFIKIVDFL